MIRGTQKQMIVLHRVDSRYFTEAFFVLREGLDPRIGRSDMVSEANRIVSESIGGSAYVRRRSRGRLRSLLFFLGGAIGGGGISLLLCLLL